MARNSSSSSRGKFLSSDHAAPRSISTHSILLSDGYPQFSRPTLHLTPLKRTLRQRDPIPGDRYSAAPLYIVVPIAEIFRSLPLSLSLSPFIIILLQYRCQERPQVARTEENNLCYARNGKRSDDFSTSMPSPVRLDLSDGAAPRPGEPGRPYRRAVRYGFPVRHPVQERMTRESRMYTIYRYECTSTSTHTCLYARGDISLV